MNTYKDLESYLKINFRNVGLLELAMTHRSYLNEHRQITNSNERLEFLGDAVLELIVSTFLYGKYPGKPEGELTLLRSKIVQTKTLAGIARKLKLPGFIRLSKGEKDSGGVNNESILADSFEALLGAVYLDQGIQKARQFIIDNLLANLDDIFSSEEVTDYKSQFQEIIQSREYPTPTYKVLRESGPDHNKIFVCAVYVADKMIAQGTGKSKQAAQQNAAKLALEKYKGKE